MTVIHDEKELFPKISIQLTGFNEAELQGTGMVEIYYTAVVRNNTPDNVRYFFEKVAQLFEESGGREAKLEKVIAINLIPASAYSNMAQNIITMWYTGNWNGVPVTGQAYVQGLVWDAAESHPPGAKQPGFGSWSMPPL